jgi:hypothetical protein
VDAGEAMQLTAKRSATVACVGGLGGLLNAALCYLRWPVSVEDSSATFRWHVMPAGLLHGLFLALVAVLAAAYASRLSLGRRWLLIPVVGWCAGYLSWIPLELSVFGGALPKALYWPVDRSWQAAWAPAVVYFGGVSAFLYAWLLLRPVGSRLLANMLAASGAGALGSLWWWISWGPWYLSVLHGAIWGCLVGAAVWELEQSARGRDRTSA